MTNNAPTVVKVIKSPVTPLVLMTTITVISPETTQDDAKRWAHELEIAYDAHYAESPPDWTWDDCHELDHDAFVELNEIRRGKAHFPLAVELISAFRSHDWRISALKLVADQQLIAA